MNSWITDRHRLIKEPPPTIPYFREAYNFALAWMQGETDFVMNTSGSTGVPKPIRVKRTQMEASATMTGAALDLPARTRALVCLNTDYIAGRMMLVRAMVLDWEIVVIEPVANPLAALGSGIPIDFVAMVPMQLATCLQENSTRFQVDRCGKILLGGAPISLTLESEIQQLQVPVYQSYGMTETVSHVALRRVNGPNRTVAYQVLAGVEYGVDVRGCLWVRGSVTNNETIQTNDLVSLEPGRSFLWLGRADSVINSGGIKIQLDKLDRVVEEILAGMNRMNSIFHWYEQDEKLGQKLVLFIENKPSVVNITDLLAKFATRVSTYEVPKAVYGVDNFTRTATDKIDRRATAHSYFFPDSYE
ncbi:AMP-binding protein [Salmonirosea aquatica]|uniref:AMP-binding protein n=1 Tax=Salmonirosea aquatica TaxID=2654236 RepID=A0A7C9BFR3_9BACT|nr:AMP-binding protein [Cytophagaceae bacterium SJW1-29]